MTELSPATPRVAIFSAHQNAYTETFVRHHVTLLPADVLHLHGGPYGWKWNGRGLFPSTLRALYVFRRRIPASWTRFATTRMDSRIGRFLRQQHVDVVLAEFATMGLDLVEPCRSQGIPLVVNCFGYDVYVRDFVEPQRERYAALFHYASAIVVMSHAMRQRVIELGAPPDRVHHSPCGVDPSFFAPPRSGPRPPRLIAVARFVEKKGPLLTIRAFALARRGCPEAVLDMVGDGALLPACRRLAKELGLADAVRFLGPLPPDRLASRLHGARAFVQHSVEADNGDSEGTPIAMLEAAAAELPAVVTRHGGFVDAVREGETGFLVDEKDLDGMAERMVRLLRDAELANTMGRQARAWVSERYTLRQEIARLKGLLCVAVVESRGARLAAAIPESNGTLG